MLRRPFAILAISALIGCGGGGGSPSAPTPTPVPVPTPNPQGHLVLNSANAVVTFRPTGKHCGDFEMNIPYSETAGGQVTVRDYDWQIFEENGNLESRASGDFNGVVAPFEHRALRWGPVFRCLDEGSYLEIVQRYATANGTVHELTGTFPINWI